MPGVKRQVAVAFWLIWVPSPARSGINPRFHPLADAVKDADLRITAREATSTPDGYGEAPIGVANG